jgi:YggT family protein
MVFIVQILQFIFQVLSIVIIVDAVLSFFMSPFHPIRQTLDRLIYPLLAPIRRIIPSVGMIDISPLILLILIQVINSVLSNLLLSIK